MTQSEKQLIAQLADASTQRQAFAVVVRQYSEQLYWHIRRIVLNHDDADDVLQNTFIKAWKNIDTFRNDAKLSTWLYRIAVNESLDFVRKQKNHLSESDIDSGGTSIAASLIADDYFDGDDAQALLQEAIASLPDVQRTVFIMRYYEDKKYSEISAILNTTEGALKASYHIAVKKITEYLQRRN